MSYFITRTNFLRVAKRVELTKEQLLEPIYKSQIYFLNKLEIKSILSVKHVLNKIKTGTIILTKSGQLEDTYTYVNEYTHYSKYHTDRNCIALKSNFKDVEIPIEIRFKPGSKIVDVLKVEEFRTWMKRAENSSLYLNDPEKFYDRMEINFNLKNRLKNQEITNKGVQEISSQSISDLEKKIDHLISYSMDYCQSNIIRAEILIGFELRLHTYYVTSERYKTEKMPNYTSYTDAIVKETLLHYFNTIKGPLINLLIDYYIISLNKGLYFDKNIMEQLEFQPCRKCVKI